MNQNPRDIILKSLDIIQYANDKEKFVDEFLDICRRKALVGLISKLSSEKQDALKQQLGQQTTSGAIQGILNQYFTVEDYPKALAEATTTIFTDYIKEVFPTLSANQKEKLHLFLQSLIQQ